MILSDKKGLITMKNRGMTLAEIIISVTLISIVLIFLMRLLTTLRYEDSFSSYEKSNSVNRSEIIKTIQTDLMAYKLFDLKDESNSVSGNSKAILHFIYADVNSTNRYLIVEANQISYCATTSCNSASDRIWKLSKSKDSVHYDQNCIKYDYDIDTSSQYFWIKFVIKLVKESFNAVKKLIAVFAKFFFFSLLILLCSFLETTVSSFSSF